MTAVPTSSTLHTLSVSLETLQRLLDRQTADGARVSADPALIEAAIEAGYEEARRIRATLAAIPYDPTAPWRRSVEILTVAVSQIDGMLDRFEEALSHLGG